MPTLKELEFQKNLNIVIFGNKTGLFFILKSPFDTDSLNKCVKRLNNTNEVTKTELYR